MSRCYISLPQMVRALAVLLLLLATAARAGDPYTVAGVPVDARGATAIAAQTEATLAGQTRAADVLLRRLTLDSEREGYTPPTPEEATRLIRAMQVANERRSANRYVGDITVAFVPARVQAFARERGLRLLDSQAADRLAVPIADGRIVGAAHPLARELANPVLDFSLAPVRLANLSALAATGVRAGDLLRGDADALSRAGQAAGGSNLLLAEIRDGRLVLSDAVASTGEVSNVGSLPLPALDPERGYMGLAQTLAARLERDWKSANASLATVDVGSQSRVSVTVLYDSLRDWQRLRDTIAGTARIRDQQLEALSNTGALMSLSYVGDAEGLVRELEGKGARMVQHPELGLVIARRGYRLP